MRRLRVLRVITRLNVGGPAHQAVLLTDRLDPTRFESWLVTGALDPGEGDFTAWHPPDSRRLITMPQLQRAIRPWKELWTLFRLYRLMRRLRPDIVHTHLAKAGALGRAAAWLARVPVIVHTYHGHVLRGYFPPGKARVFIRIERWLARVTTRLIAVSHSVRSELVELGIGRVDQYVVVPLGLELRRYLACERLRGELRRELGIKDEDPVIGTVARLVPIKRHQDFLEAAANVLTEEPNVRFLIVGDGEERGMLERMAQQRGVHGSVHFLGWRQDLDRIYADCDVVALSSANEGSPVSLIESMASARPVVATRVGGVPDVVEHGTTGLLVPAENPRELASAMLALIRDPDRRTQMGWAARTRVQDAYDAERLLRDLGQLYHALWRGDVARAE